MSRGAFRIDYRRKFSQILFRLLEIQTGSCSCTSLCTTFNLLNNETNFLFSQFFSGFLNGFRN